MKIEKYTEDYSAKSYYDGYAYYVDDLNREVSRKVLEKYLIEQNLDVLMRLLEFDERIGNHDAIMSFKHYDVIFSLDVENSTEMEKGYTIIKVVE